MSIASVPTDPDEPLRSVCTSNLSELLRSLGCSVVLSTYQAGKLIFVRADGNATNTHFRLFDRPMGMAVAGNKLTLGTASEIWDYRNVPAVASKLEPGGTSQTPHDGCYVPRRVHFTGDIDIHEMAYGDGPEGPASQLWFLNTRFSCLCTLDQEHSFVPRWRPPFVSAYDLSDRCHLNGLAMRDGQPRYVTALGATDSPEGWRKRKADGGILMDITTNEILVEGLSMPHSPRWYGGGGSLAEPDRLWLLESGRGTLSTVDLASGKAETVAKLPGFTRGIDFWGDLAFIGLSKVRESAVFSGIPIAQESERYCGLWVVNVRSGETVAFLRFEAAVQEIFAVQVLPGVRFPELLDATDERRELVARAYVLPDAALAQTLQPEAIVPESLPGFHFLAGNEAYEKADLAAAVASYRRCLDIDPNFLDARQNLAIALGDLEQDTEAEQLLTEVIAADPSRAQPWNYLGLLWARRRSPERAAECYERAIALEPTWAIPHHNLSMVLLQTDQWARGWAEAEWRWQTPQFTPFVCPHPQWDGRELPGGTLLVHTEQGAGDAIQFARFLPLAAQRCHKLVLVCPEPLYDLFGSIAGVAERWLPGTLEVSSFDTWLPLMSLPHVLGCTLETLPRDVPYLSAGERSCPVPLAPPLPSNGFGPPATAKPSRRRKKTDSNADANSAVQSYPHDRPLKIGLAWAGSPTQGNDRRRSCPLALWQPLLEARPAGIQFFSLQKGEAACAQLAQLPPKLRAKVHDLAPQLTNFADTAAAIVQLDLVISVDTSVAHLAGALGKPAWVLLCYNPDWRWRLAGQDSPWYPTLRLFRQPQPDDWASVIAQVVAALG